MWYTWKKKTRAAVETAGMLAISDDENHAKRNPVDNETIYHLLQKLQPQMKMWRTLWINMRSKRMEERHFQNSKLSMKGMN